MFTPYAQQTCSCEDINFLCLTLLTSLQFFLVFGVCGTRACIPVVGVWRPEVHVGCLTLFHLKLFFFFNSGTF